MRALMCASVLLLLITPGYAVAQTGNLESDLKTDGKGNRTDSKAQAIEQWKTFTQNLEQAGIKILESTNTRDEIDIARANLYLAQQLTNAVTSVMDEHRLDIPVLRIGATTINKWGLDAADAKYLGAPIDPEGTYRLYGALGNAQVISIQSIHSGSTFKAFDSADQSKLMSNAQGEFELLITQSKPDDWQGAFLALAPESNRLVIREYFGDWEREYPSTFMLERVDDTERHTEPNIEQSGQLLQEMAHQFAQRAPFWNGWVQNSRAKLKNTLRTLRGNNQGLSNNVYGDGWFDIHDDEALLIELPAPEAQLWSFQLGNIWWESIDYVSGLGSINSFQAKADPDGIYRLVIAKADPGLVNWLDTAGRNEGSIMYRYQNTNTEPEPSTRLVKLSELSAILPASTAKASHADREAAIQIRKSHVQRRWSP